MASARSEVRVAPPWGTALPTVTVPIAQALGCLRYCRRLATVRRANAAWRARRRG